MPVLDEQSQWNHPLRGDGSLPADPQAFREELRRRLALLARETRGLAPYGASDGAGIRPEPLTSLLRELEGLLSASERLDLAAWTEGRRRIVAVWRDSRRELERLVISLSCQHTVRPGQRDRGPVW